MKPELLVFSSSPSAAVMAQMEQQYSCHHVWQVAPAERGAFIDAVAAKVQAVWTAGPVGISNALVDQLPKLEVVVCNSVGFDKIEFESLRARGIPVTNTPGVLTDDVADLTVLLLLATARRLPVVERYVRAGDWAAGKPLKATRSVRGKVAGVFGFGRIGQAIVERLRPLGMEFMYYQPRAVEGVDVPRAESLLALAEQSDYLILCAPATSATRNIVDAAVLEALGPDGTLINIARGALVDEPALVSALQSGKLGAAGLDVFANEPHAPEGLFGLDNVVLTPHIGSLTVETRHAMGQLTLDNLAAHFAGQPLLTPVR